MDQFSKNESKVNGSETYEVFMNDVIMEERSKDNPNVQTKTKKTSKNE